MAITSPLRERNGMPVSTAWGPIPLRLAEGLGERCSEARRYAFVYVAVVFFLVPILLIALTNLSGVRRLLGL